MERTKKKEQEVDPENKGRPYMERSGREGTYLPLFQQMHSLESPATPVPSDGAAVFESRSPKSASLFS